MPELSLPNIDQITRDIRKEEITFSHLQEELIDHVCCDVESEMKSGCSFQEAYTKIKKKMGARRIKEIQEETLYAIDTKYRNMKKLMKISGITGTIIIGFAALFKIQHWPLSGMMLTLGALILAFMFMPSTLGILWKETHNRNSLFLYISGFFAGTFFILGTLFKVQHWPGAALVISLSAFTGILMFIPSLLADRLADSDNKRKRPVYILGAVSMASFSAGMLFKIMHWPLSGLLMVSGLVFFCIIVLPWYTWLTWSKESNVNSVFIFIIIGSLLIIVPSALININLQNVYESGFFYNIDQQEALFNSMMKNSGSKLNLYPDSSVNKEFEELHFKTENLLELIYKTEEEMILQAEGQTVIDAKSMGLIKNSDLGTEIQYLQLSNPFYTSSYIDNLYLGINSGSKLGDAIMDYTDYIKYLKSESSHKEYLNLLNPEIFFPPDVGENENPSLMVALHSLVLLKNCVLLVEAETLDILENQ